MTTAEARASAHVALAKGSPYLYPPDIAEGQTCAQYVAARRTRRRRWWQRLWRRLNGHA